jgi:hypothetical protein
MKSCQSVRRTEKKVVPVTGRGGPLGCDKLKLPYFLDNRFTDGGKVVSLALRPHFYP